MSSIEITREIIREINRHSIEKKVIGKEIDSPQGSKEILKEKVGPNSNSIEIKKWKEENHTIMRKFIKPGMETWREIIKNLFPRSLISEMSDNTLHKGNALVRENIRDRDNTRDRENTQDKDKKSIMKKEAEEGEFVNDPIQTGFLSLMISKQNENDKLWD